MKIKVIEITKDGLKWYLRGTSIFGEKPTENPAEATNYALAENAEQMRHDLWTVACMDIDKSYARSGIRSDTLPQIVEFEITYTEVSRQQGRDAAP